MPDVLILSGPPGAGKTSAAQALAERYDRVAHIQVDTFRHFIAPTAYVPLSGPKEAWRRQQRMLTRAASAAALAFLDERFGVIIDDVIVDREFLSLYIDSLRPANAPVHFVVLLPSLEVCLDRIRKRDAHLPGDDRVSTAHSSTSQPGLAAVTIDNSDLTAYQTADKLQALTTSGESLVWAPASV